MSWLISLLWHMSPKRKRTYDPSKTWSQHFYEYLYDRHMHSNLSFSFIGALKRPLSDFFEMTDQAILMDLHVYTGHEFVAEEVEEFMNIVYAERADKHTDMKRPMSKQEHMTHFWMVRLFDYHVAASIARALKIWPSDLSRYDDLDIRSLLMREDMFKHDTIIIDEVLQTLHDEDPGRSRFAWHITDHIAPHGALATSAPPVFHRFLV